MSTSDLVLSHLVSAWEQALADQRQISEANEESLEEGDEARKKAEDDIQKLREKVVTKESKQKLRFALFLQELRNVAAPFIALVNERREDVDHHHERLYLVQPDPATKKFVGDLLKSNDEIVIHNLALMISHYIRWEGDWGSAEVQEKWEEKLPATEIVKLFLDKEAQKGPKYIATAAKYTKTDWYHIMILSSNRLTFLPPAELDRLAKKTTNPKEVEIVTAKIKTEKDIDEIFSFLAGSHWGLDYSKVEATLTALNSLIKEHQKAILAFVDKTWSEYFNKVEPIIHTMIALLLVSDAHDEYTDEQLAKYPLPN
ncbi:hypothetical protein B7463_g11220, partial [Scytalidium lignicola]